MAQPKNIKKQVRARMERTGESYTTARKNILDGKPESPKAVRAAAARTGTKPGTGAKPAAKPKPTPQSAAPAVEEEELPEYPAPEHVVQYDAALWQRVLTQAGVTHPMTGQPLSQELLAGLAGGIGFTAFTHLDEDEPSATLMTRSPGEPFTATLLARCGATINERTTNSPERAADYLDTGLDAGRAVVVRVAVHALPWVSDDGIDPQDTIDVAVVGEHEQFLLIDDGSGSLAPITPEDLATARASRKRDKHWQAWVPTTRGPELETLRGNILQAIEATTGYLLGHRESRSVPPHLARHYGIAGMRWLAEKLADTDSPRGFNALLTTEERINTVFDEFCAAFSETRLAGPEGLRGLYAEFLDEAAALPGLEDLAEHAAAYQRLGEHWEELIGQFSAQIDPEARAETFTTAGQTLQRIADAEEQAARNLEQCAQRLAANLIT